MFPRLHRWVQEMNFRNNSLNVQSDFGKKLWTRTSQNSPLHTGIGEGNGNPLQCSCLENPRDGGAWWAAVYGVTQSRTRLKRLSSSSSSVSELDTLVDNSSSHSHRLVFFTQEIFSLFSSSKCCVCVFFFNHILLWHLRVKTTCIL